MNDSDLVFVTGSGRCGTRMMKVLFSGVPSVEARHEYVRNAYQRDAVLYYMGWMSKNAIAGKLWDIFEGGRLYSPAKTFLDASHKTAWCIDVLAEIFPKAKFVHLVRDGRKVASSFFYKLNIHDDRSYKALLDWVDGKEGQMPPPPENFWWPWKVREPDRFRRICRHWVESNLAIEKHLPEGRSLTVRLEDITRDRLHLTQLLHFVGVEYDDSFWDVIQKPKHVYVPIDYQLTDGQTLAFWQICGDLMRQYGYEEEYRVKYQM